MWQDCWIAFPHTRPCYAKSSYQSVDPQTRHGNVHPAGRPRAKWTDQLRHDNNNAPTRLCGGKLLVAVTRERRYGPNRLRVNDDDSSFTCNVIIDVQKTRKPFAVGLLPEPRWVSLSPLQVHLGNIYNSSPLNASGISVRFVYGRKKLGARQVYHLRRGG